MQIRFSIVALSALGLMAGCSNGGSASTTPNPPKEVAANSSPAAPTPSVEKTKPTSPAPKTTPKTPSTTNSAASSTPKAGPAPITLEPAATKAAAKTGVVVPSDGKWYAIGLSPVELGNEVDGMIKSLSGVQVNVNYVMTMATGKLDGRLVDKLRDSHVYALQIPIQHIDPKRGLMPALAWVRSTGDKVTTRVDKNIVTRPPGVKAVPQTMDLVQNWPKNANREVFAGLVDQRQPFSEYFKALLNKKSGYTVRVAERRQPYKGKIVDQYMLSAVRNPDAAKTLGASSVFVVVDARIHLPVNIRATIKKPGARLPDSILWDAEWVNHQKFDDSEFKSPPQVASVATQ